jgi:hypothetical protein
LDPSLSITDVFLQPPLATVLFTYVLVSWFKQGLKTLNMFSFYRSITATLCSRLVLNLRGLILRPAYHEEMTIDLSMLVCDSHPGHAPIATPNATETVEVLEAETDGELKRRKSDSID